MPSDFAHSEIYSVPDVHSQDFQAQPNPNAVLIFKLLALAGYSEMELTHPDSAQPSYAMTDNFVMYASQAYIGNVPSLSHYPVPPVSLVTLAEDEPAEHGMHKMYILSNQVIQSFSAADARLDLRRQHPSFIGREVVDMLKHQAMQDPEGLLECLSIASCTSTDSNRIQ